jgi:acetyl esterase/lipase
VPIHPSQASRFHLLEGIESFEAGLADPTTRARLDEFMSITGASTPPAADVRDDTAPGPHGPVPVRVYTPLGGGTDLPCLVWLHGGAFRMGDLDMPEADWTAREICERAGAVVVSVDYRLCVGGVTYPVPHDDAVAAVRWVLDGAASLGVDRGRISLGGASAGGNLATGAALRLRDEDGWVPAALLLAYTTLHAVVPPPSPSLAPLLDDIPRLLRFLPEDRRSITENYLGGPASTADGYAMPANAVLEGLCPVLLLNSEYDDLRASAEAFAGQLAVAGVDVRQVLVPGMLHGFLNLRPEVEPVDEALDVMARVVGTATLPSERAGTLHPAIAAKLPLLDGIAGWQELTDPAKAARMQEFDSWPSAAKAPAVDTRTDDAPGPHGDVPVRIYTPSSPAGRDLPALVWAHGGAFLGGDLDMIEADGVAREICARAGAVVVSVDYRLCHGGVTYPVPHDDVVAAVRWVRDRADDLGVDADRISIGGASAGANLTAGAVLRLRDDDGWTPASLLSVYPVAHAALPPASSALAAVMAPLPRMLRFLPEDTDFITGNYLGGPFTRADGYAMPALAVLSGLCPVVVLNAEFDDLRSSGEAFTAALARAGVDVRQVLVRGLPHGFLDQPAGALEPVDQALDLMAQVVTDVRTDASAPLQA